MLWEKKEQKLIRIYSMLTPLFNSQIHTAFLFLLLQTQPQNIMRFDFSLNSTQWCYSHWCTYIIQSSFMLLTEDSLHSSWATITPSDFSLLLFRHCFRTVQPTLYTHWCRFKTNIDHESQHPGNVEKSFWQTKNCWARVWRKMREKKVWATKRIKSKQLQYNSKRNQTVSLKHIWAAIYWSGLGRNEKSDNKYDLLCCVVSVNRTINTRDMCHTNQITYALGYSHSDT